MKKLIGCIIMFSVSSLLTSAQQKENTPLRMATIAQVGLLNGETGQSALLEATVGVTKNKWFAGLGTGIDYYSTRAIPVFAAVQKQFGNKKVAPFAYTNAGVAFGWATQNQQAAKWYQYKAQPGAYFDGGVGVKLKTGNGTGLLLSAGYSSKQVIEKATSFNSWPRPMEGNQYEYYKYQYRRIIIKVGFSF